MSIISGKASLLPTTKKFYFDVRAGDVRIDVFLNANKYVTDADNV